MSNQVMEELWNGLAPAASSAELANAVVDRLVELKVDLQEVSLAEMKTLLANAYIRSVRGEVQPRNRSVSDCVIAS
ncbi:hypothetical protein [uncultured Gimesia sp.]|uniref:hypothetical protein n=1 Tax=uncultured Gimesia sp. TaxID=1678688 RepID=UPI0030DA962F|tara:strand:- start:35336 stop:35563 length:228 start_codon:yes stop_codon:yes gene_type:complete